MQAYTEVCQPFKFYGGHGQEGHLHLRTAIFGIHLERTYSLLVDTHFIPIHIIQARIPTGNFWVTGPAFDPSARTWSKALRPKGWGKKTKCVWVRENSFFFFWQRLLQLSGWHSSTGATVKVLLSEQCGELAECFCLSDRGGGELHPSPSRGEWYWWEVDLIQSSTFFLFWISVSLFFLFFFCASECCQAQRGKERCDGVGCLWMRFKHREHFQ